MFDWPGMSLHVATDHCPPEIYGQREIPSDVRESFLMRRAFTIKHRSPRSPSAAVLFAPASEAALSPIGANRKSKRSATVAVLRACARLAAATWQPQCRRGGVLQTSASRPTTCLVEVLRRIVRMGSFTPSYLPFKSSLASRPPEAHGGETLPRNQSAAAFVDHGCGVGVLAPERVDHPTDGRDRICARKR
jgi:hypothetical protein